MAIKQGTTLWWMIQNAHMLIVYEFSLLSNNLLHMLHDILHTVCLDRHTSFGGITLLILGNPLQLPGLNMDGLLGLEDTWTILE